MSALKKKAQAFEDGSVANLETFRNKLSPEYAEKLLGFLLAWLVRLVEAGEKRLVVRKLCSALVAVFVQSGGRWAHCVWHVIVSLHEKRPIHPSLILPKSNWKFSVGSLAAYQIQPLVCFATLLVEEVNKASPHGVETYVDQPSSLLG